MADKKSIVGFLNGQLKVVGDITIPLIQLEPEIKIKPQPSWTEPELDRLFMLAEQLADVGRFREAFRVTRVGAEAGDRSMQLNLGRMYDIGQGVRRNRARAMYWYKRAYRRGDSSAANNIGTIYRDEKRWTLALRWFRRAVSMGDDDANYEIAEVLLAIGKPASQIRPYLKRVLGSNRVCEMTEERAAALLETLAAPKSHR